MADCPRCVSPLRVEDWGAGISALCPVCLWQSRRFPSREKAEAEVSALAWWEPRPRLPTPAEEAAHRERHGEGAGWMVRCYIGGEWRDWGIAREFGAVHPHPVQSYPHVNGRPVGWPSEDV